MAVATILPRVTPIRTAELIELLVDANVTDPERWPQGARHGAVLLVRIREIEAECRARHGEWDWELLDPDTRDEYDNARCDLNELMDDEPPVPLREFERRMDDLDRRG